MGTYILPPNQSKATVVYLCRMQFSSNCRSAVNAFSRLPGIGKNGPGALFFTYQNLQNRASAKSLTGKK
jgi:hypothetical protein